MILLETLYDNSPSARNFQKLAEIVVDTGGVSAGIRFGTAQATWSGSIASGGVTIPHGLARVPVFAEASTRNGLIHYAVTARDETNITVVGYVTYNSAFTGGPITFDWLVIG